MCVYGYVCVCVNCVGVGVGGFALCVGVRVGGCVCGILFKWTVAKLILFQR